MRGSGGGGGGGHGAGRVLPPLGAANLNAAKLGVRPLKEGGKKGRSELDCVLAADSPVLGGRPGRISCPLGHSPRRE